MTKTEITMATTRPNRKTIKFNSALRAAADTIDSYNTSRAVERALTTWAQEIKAGQQLDPTRLTAYTNSYFQIAFPTTEQPTQTTVYFRSGVTDAVAAIGEHLDERTDVRVPKLHHAGGYNRQLIVTVALLKLADDIKVEA